MKLYTPLVSPRVDAIVYLIEFVCGVVSIFIGFYGFWFVDFCIGAILAMPIAVIIGVAVSRRYDGHKPDILLRGAFGFLLALMLNCFAFGGFILPMIDGKTNTERIRNLREGNVEQIAFYDEFGKKVIGVIDDDEVLNQFVQRSKDIQVNQPRCSHCSSDDSWQVKIYFSEDPPMTIRWTHLGKYQRSVFGLFLDGESTLAITHGTFYSEGMREWFAEHVAENMPAD